jgi:hypothetical protein
MHQALCVNPYHISIAVRELDLFLANFIHCSDPLSNDNGDDDSASRGAYTHVCRL